MHDVACPACSSPCPPPVLRCRRCGAIPTTAHGFVLVGEHTRGPLDHRALLSAVRAKEIDDDTLVWHEGLADWARWGELGGLPVAPTMFEVGAGPSPFSGQAADPETSVLFSLRNLREAATDVRRAGLTNAPSEGSGLIDIRALAEAARDRPPSPAPSLALMPTNVVIGPTHRAASRPSALLVAMLAVSALVLASASFVLGRASHSEASVGEIRPVARAAPRAVEPREAVPAVVAVTEETGAPPAAMPMGEPMEETAEEPVEERASPGARSVTRRGRPRTASAEPAVPSAEPVVEARGPRSIGELIDGATPGLARPDTPSRAAVRGALEAIAPRTRACADGVHGTAILSLVLSGETGRAERVTTIDGASGALAACIERAAAGVRVPPFRNPTFTVRYPLAY